MENHIILCPREKHSLLSAASHIPSQCSLEVIYTAYWGHHKKKKKFTRVTINLSALRGGREGERGAIAEQQPLHLLGNSKRVKIRKFPSGINTVSQKTSVWDRKSLLEGYLALILNI